jgi:hypothetical protein
LVISMQLYRGDGGIGRERQSEAVQQQPAPTYHFV